jgi:hypothetical protein
MLRAGVTLRSLAMNRTTPFTAAALRALQMTQQHRELMKDARSEAAAQQLREDFARHVEDLRPLFRVSESMQAGKFYSGKLFTSLEYFGMTDDPLYRQLQSQLGMLAKRHRPKASALHRHLATSGASPSSGLSPRVETSPEELPTELPQQPENGDIPATSLKFRNQFRGHWVLQDPEIAISKRERREDPW